jgi:ATP-dependent DNA helicase UvrD/PcrA
VNELVTREWFVEKDGLLGGAKDISKFDELKLAPTKEVRIRRPYSVTADVLAFRRCSRQYGYFAVKKFVPAQFTQLYFGIVIHEVLDRAHRQYSGLIEGKPKGVPKDSDIEEYFHTVTAALRARGIRPYSTQAEESAKNYLKRFNSHHGPSLYPRVIDTEHKLRADMKDFYLHGVVDVLAKSPGDDSELEIWDYKGSKRVEDDSDEMKNYRFQMQVYAELYKLKNGKYPTRAILCFIGEDSLEKMTVEVPFNTGSTSEAMKVFIKTVAEIELRREKDDWSPPSEMPSSETCGACDIRWDCVTVKGKYKIRTP